MAIGIVKQARGPFNSSDNIISKFNIPSNTDIKLGITIDEKDFFQLSAPPEELEGFFFNINNEEYKMGRTCMYETDGYYTISSLVFPNGAPQSVIVQCTY